MNKCDGCFGAANGDCDDCPFRTIAHSLGGGGHKKAAGSMFDGKSIRDDVIKQVIDMKEIFFFRVNYTFFNERR